MNSRNQSLDVLRGLAVLMVVVCHYPMLQFMYGGWMGVDLFFVLSGFLISGLLFRELGETDGIRIGTFLIRRGFKIYPAFYGMLLLTALAVPAARRSLLVEAIFFQNYVVPPAANTIWIHTWSLAVEEHFYIALPLLLIGLHRIERMRWVPLIAIGVFIGCLAMRAAVTPNADARVLMYPTHLRMDSLFAGVALSYFAAFHKEEFNAASHWVLLPASALLLIPSFLSSLTGPQMLGLSFNTVGFSLLLLWAVTRSLPWSSPLSWVGRYSYSIYLWHWPVKYFLFAPRPNWVTFFLYVGSSIVAGFVMAKVIELPALRIRDRLTGSQVPARLTPRLIPPVA